MPHLIEKETWVDPDLQPLADIYVLHKEIKSKIELKTAELLRLEDLLVPDIAENLCITIGWQINGLYWL